MVKFISFKRVFAAVAFSCLSIPAMWGAGAADVIAQADAVVVGTITTGLQSADNVSFDIDVLRVLKGANVPPIVHVNHSWRRIGIVIGPTTTEISGAFTGVWFLKNGAANFDVMTFGGPDGLLPSLFLPAMKTLPATLQYTVSAPVTDKVVLEVAAAVEFYGQHTDALLNAAWSLNTPAVQTVLSDLLNSKIVALQSAGLAGILSRGEPGAIAKLIQLWPAVSQDKSSYRVMMALRDAYRDTTPSAVQQLVALAGQTRVSPDLRTAAINAIAAIHTREALPFLASLLTSDDPSERMKGVFGLSSFANGCVPQTPNNVVSLAYLQIPASAPYETPDTVANFGFRPGPADQEAALVSFWSSWWSEHPDLH